MAQTAAVIVCLLLGALAIFQAGLALGAPWGRLAWGGQHERLPTRLRVASAVSILLYALFAAVVLDRADVVDVLPDVVSRAGTWALTAYFGLGVGLNGISRSRPEALTMAPVCLILCISCLVLALS